MEKNKKQDKRRFDVFDYLEIGVYGFFLFFFMIYIGRYGISDLILKGGSTHELLFNIGAWFVLVGFCMDGVFNKLKLNKVKDK